MDLDEDDVGASSSFGLNRVLASSGIDPNAFSSFFSKTGGTSSSAFADLDANSDSDKYEDDVSDIEQPVEDVRAREREKADEERWYRRAMEMQKEAEKRKVQDKVFDEMDRVREVWPDFVKGRRLRMTEVFYETPKQKRGWAVAFNRKKRRKVGTQTYHLRVAPDTSIPPNTAFLLPSLAPLPIHSSLQARYATPIGAYFEKEWIRSAKLVRREDMTKPPADLSLETQRKDDDLGKTLDLADWEKDIVMCSLDVVQPKRSSEALDAHNDILESGDWMKDVIWDARRVSPDLFGIDDEEPNMKRDTEAPDAAQSATKSNLDPYNLSNDHLYEHTRETRYRIRQTFGAIEVFHSQPAKDLQMPFYKTSLSKSEARAWRRPAIQIPVGITITFSRLKSNPSASVRTKKKAMMVDPSERFKTTKDLTMAEKGPFVLLEFSEEYPPILSGYGMGTTIVNYYRKKDDKDEHVPKLDIGQPSILNVGDAEPFLLGYVDKGQVTQVAHNKLSRGPIFRHTPATTDFLVIRQAINGHTSYHLRAINNIYTVGQTVPNEMEIPGPHARKNTNTAKLRLMVVAWLLITKAKQKRIKITKLMKYFPDHTELQMRQRLKIKGNEFLIYARQQGPNQGYWMLNPEYNFPSVRREVLDLVTPESAMIYEAMQVGARHLHDAGYAKTAEGKEEEDFGDEAGILDIEQQLAVWSTTLNYKRAETQKAWIAVHGEGDPTGRGEGFSFLRTNMKGYFLRKGETEQGRRLDAESKSNGSTVKISNGEQNRIYEEEKRKVWDLQWAALSNPKPPQLSAQDEYQDRVVNTTAALGPRFARTESRRAFSRGNSTAATPVNAYAESPRDMSPSAFSADGESAYTGNPTAGKVMRIKRVVKGKTQIEIVRDPAVIQSYLRQVEEHKLQEYMEQAENLQPTGNLEEDELKKAALRQEIEKHRKNQARRAARKKYTQQKEGIFDEEAADSGKRRCGACGALGHTKANRNCPMFNVNSIGPSPVGTTPTGATPGGFSAVNYGEIPPPDMGAGAGTSFKIRLGTASRG